MQDIDRIAETCSAYQMGFTASQLGLSTIYNEFEQDSESHIAWMIGYNVGARKELIEFEEGWIN